MLGCIASVNKRGQQLHLYKFKASYPVTTQLAGLPPSAAYLA